MCVVYSSGMLNIPFRRRLTPFRAAVLAMLVLTLAVQPVLAVLGESHEHSGHTVDTAVNAPDPAQKAVRIDSAPGPDSGNAIHALLHAAHCCGNIVAFASVDVSTPSFASVAVIPEASGVDAEPTSYASSPFRPPISG